MLGELALGQGILGLYQSATSGAGEATSDFENFAKTANPLAQRSKSLDDYYQQALSRYNENPYQSQQYQLGAMNARRATASALENLQTRHAALSGAEKLAAIENSSLQNLGGQAENRRDARFGAYGQAAQLQNQQDKYIFNINKELPFERQLQIKQLKAQAANDRYNAGINMIGNAFGNYAMGSMYGGANVVKPTSAIGPSSQDTFNSWMGDKSLMPQANSNYFPKNGLTPIAERFGYGSGNLYGYRPAGGNSALNSIFTPNTFINDMSNWNKARSLGG